MKSKKYLSVIVSTFLIGIILSSSIIIGTSSNEIKQKASSMESQPYEGYLRVYIVEPVSRWNNFDGEPYTFGCLDIALNEKLSVEYQDTITETITWDAAEAGFADIDEENIMTIIVLNNPVINRGYAKPPIGNFFEAHYVDATIGLYPGETKEAIPENDFTHTVFIEEATATWCPYCPPVANALHSIYESGDYPFYYVALISDTSEVVFNYLYGTFNLYAYPSAFFDGGRKSLVGGYSEEDKFTSRINYSGVQPVHDLDVTASFQINEPGVLDIEVEITNNEEIINSPPEQPSIEGPTTAKYGEEQKYTFSTNDPDGNNVYYIIDWGDGSELEIVGPSNSGSPIGKKHTWEERGTYTVQVKAKDIYDKETDWTALEVSMPKKLSISLPALLKEKFPLFFHFSSLIS